MRVIVTTGMPGAGKSLAIDVAEELGYEVVRMGDLVREEVERRGLPQEPESFGKVASELREREGQAVWAERTAERLEPSQARTVLIDGARNLEEVGVFRRRIDEDVLIVAILASPSTRYERLAARGRIEDQTDDTGYLDRDLRELEYGLGDVIAMADIYIENEGDPSEAQATLHAVLSAGE